MQVHQLIRSPLSWPTDVSVHLRENEDGKEDEKKENIYRGKSTTDSACRRGKSDVQRSLEDRTQDEYTQVTWTLESIVVVVTVCCSRL